MTQEEFYLRSIIAMTQNPKYVKMATAYDDQNIKFPSLEVDIMLEDADYLLEQVRKRWLQAFDAEGGTIQYSISKIVDELQNINNGGLTVYNINEDD